MKIKAWSVALFIFVPVLSVAWADTLAPSAPENLRLDVTGGNTPPKAVDDLFSTPQGRRLVITAPGVLANDSDPYRSKLAAELVSGTEQGRLSFNPDGSFSYTPPTGFSGSDSFSYRAQSSKGQSNIATVVITVKAAVEPWFRDDFEGEPPRAWNPLWGPETPGKAYGITAELSTPAAGGRYAYRQYYFSVPRKAAMADHTTNTIICPGHGYPEGTIVRFVLGEGGTLPGGLLESSYYRVINPTVDTFQLSWPPGTAIHGISSDGEPLWQVFEGISAGPLTIGFGGDSPIPLISDGEDISFSYWLKYHPQFEFGLSSGHKIIIMGSEGGSDRFDIVLQGGNEVKADFQATHRMRPANVNGGPYKMTAGEWVKFDWYIRFSSGTDGVLKGWVNGILRWDYTFQTLELPGNRYRSWQWWTQNRSDMPLGGIDFSENTQQRLVDNIEIGPGEMVLSQFE